MASDGGGAASAEARPSAASPLPATPPLSAGPPRRHCPPRHHCPPAHRVARPPRRHCPPRRKMERSCERQIEPFCRARCRLTERSFQRQTEQSVMPRCRQVERSIKRHCRSHGHQQPSPASPWPHRCGSYAGRLQQSASNPPKGTSFPIMSVPLIHGENSNATGDSTGMGCPQRPRPHQ